MLRMARTAHAATGLDDLCLAGGVALNCVGNGRVLREGPFRRLWIQPAAGDAGGALGVAQLIWHRHCKQPRARPGRTTEAALAAPVAMSQARELAGVGAGAQPAMSARERAVTGSNGGQPEMIDAMRGAYLGPEFSPAQIEEYLQSEGVPAKRMDRQPLLDRVAELLSQGKVIGWLNGRMEFGPRSLGARSILGDPRSAAMQAQMNLKIKFRESFRPFAPSVLRERVSDYFEMDCDSPYMLLVAPVKQERRIAMTAEQRTLWGIEQLNVPRSDMPAITHIDYSARVQTVSRATNPDYHDLLLAFERRTGCAVLVNTSFNVRGEPIVCTPADAYRCFMRTHIDHLVLWPFILDKTEQPTWSETANWKSEFQLD